jgi:hypothetical protein
MKAPLNIDDLQWHKWDICPTNGIRSRDRARLRFGISGHLPNASGEDQERFNLHTNSSCATALVAMEWVWDGSSP